MTAISFVLPQLTERWNDESSGFPSRSTIARNTPFTLVARPTTVTWPGFGIEPVLVVPIVAVYAHLRTFLSKMTSYAPVPRCALDTTCGPRAVLPSDPMTAKYCVPQYVCTWNGSSCSAPVDWLKVWMNSALLLPALVATVATAGSSTAPTLGSPGVAM